MIKDYFDVVIILTESDLTTERRANRFHWARMLRDTGLEVFLVQPNLKGPISFDGLEGITFLYGGQNALRGKVLRKILKSNVRILFWNYGSTYSDIIPRSRGFLIHHATEDYLNPTFPWRNASQRYLGDLIRIMSRANLVIAVSEGVSENIARVLSPEVNLRVICNAYDPKSFYREDKLGLESKQFVYQGGVNERLDWDLLFQLAEIYPDFQFMFYGHVDLPHHILNQLPKNFELCGQVSIDDLRKAMNESTAALIPFKDENWLNGSFPLKTFEYLACSLRIYSSRIDSVLAIQKGVQEISSLIPRKEIRAFDQTELEQIQIILQENTYESRLATLNDVLDEISPSIRIEEESPRVCVIYDSASLHVETIKEHLLSLWSLKGFEVYFLSSRDGIDSNFEEFDILIVHYSVRLCFEGHLPSTLKKKISRFKGLKCAFLQDEYDQTDVAIQNLLEIGVMLVFTCVKESRVDEVYGPLVSKGVKFKQVLTGFALHPDEKRNHIRETSKRTWDLGYRGRKLSHRYGKLGYDKWQIGELAKLTLSKSDLSLNISSETFDRIYGEAWFDFLGNCKAVLGTESGSNVFDFSGNLEVLSQKYSNMHFLDFEKEHLLGLEIDGLMNQISPRIFEAISTKTALVLFPGSYSDVLKPWKHYFVIEKDFSNYSDLINFLKDDVAISNMAQRCYEDIVLSGKYDKEKFIATIESGLRDSLYFRINPKLNPVPEEFRDKPMVFDSSGSSFWLQGNSHSAKNRFFLYKVARFLWRRIPTRTRYRFAWYLPIIERSLRKIFYKRI